MTVETMKPRFTAPGGANVAAALSRMNLAAFRVSLDEIVGMEATGDATSSAGFLLSGLVCGRSLYEPPEGYPCASRLSGQGQLSDLQVTFSSSSCAGPAGFLSAITEAVPIQKLTLNMGVLSDRIPWLNEVRWGGWRTRCGVKPPIHPFNRQGSPISTCRPVPLPPLLQR